jgi:hypothetical protein
MLCVSFDTGISTLAADRIETVQCVCAEKPRLIIGTICGGSWRRRRRQRFNVDREWGVPVKVSPSAGEPVFLGPRGGSRAHGRGRRAMGACACCLPGHAPPSEGGLRAVNSKHSKRLTVQPGRLAGQLAGHAAPGGPIAPSTTLNRGTSARAGRVGAGQPGAASDMLGRNCRPRPLSKLIARPVFPKASWEQSILRYRPSAPSRLHLNDQLTATDTL